MSVLSNISTSQTKRPFKKYTNDSMNSVVSSINTTIESIKTRLSHTLNQTVDDELDEIRERYIKEKKEKIKNDEDDVINNVKYKTFSPSPYIYSSSYKFFSEDYKYGILADIRDCSAYRVEKYEGVIESLYASLGLIKGKKVKKGKRIEATPNKKKLNFDEVI